MSSRCQKIVKGTQKSVVVQLTSTCSRYSSCSNAADSAQFNLQQPVRNPVLLLDAGVDRDEIRVIKLYF